MSVTIETILYKNQTPILLMPTRVVGRGSGRTDGTLIVYKIEKSSLTMIEKGKFSGYVYNPTTGRFEYIEGYINSYSYTYDANGNLTELQLEIVDENENPIATIKVTYTYDANNNLIKKSRWEVV